MSKELGKWVVFWGSGNVHHFFNTYAAAEKYCISGSNTGHFIAYVVAQSPPKKLDKVAPELITYLGKPVKEEK